MSAVPVRDRSLLLRMALSGVLVLVGYAALVVPLWYYGSPVVAFVVGVLLGLGLLFLLSQGHRLALWTSRAMGLSRTEYPNLYARLERLSRQADVSTPGLAVVPTDEPNAFTAGSGDDAVVFVTLGFLRELPPEEQDAVLAHELAHVKNADALVMTVAAFPTTVALLLVAFGLAFLNDASFWSKSGRNTAFVGGVVFLAGGALFLASVAAVVVLSRYREFAADRGAVAITGDPTSLASALRRLDGGERETTRRPNRDARSLTAMHAFCVVPSGDWLPFFPALHPPTEARVERLRAMERDAESVR
ncbi:M48 family metalloprotease [Halobium salinum]|uniref:M48 family metalloprotease n=1 Tax=Halobium salinum TaxID=1364940 RepID=A0ABD5PG52_9EURY|nr:M48 family metalloprotease [Halobium salinum]